MIGVNRTLVRQVLESTAGQLEPHLSNLEAALERPLDAPSFAMGLIAAGLVMGRMDTVTVARMMRTEFDHFLAEVEKREAKDLGPYSPGILTSGYYRPDFGLSFEPGTEIRWRVVNDRFVEVMFPPFDGTLVRWLERAQVAGTEA